MLVQKTIVIKQRLTSPYGYCCYTLIPQHYYKIFFLST